MPTSTLLTALLVFVAVALGTISAALVLEWAQERYRARNVTRQLREFSERAFGVDAQVVRRPDAVTWLEEVALRVPWFSGLGALLRRSGSNWTLQSYLLTTVGLMAAFGLSAGLFAGNALVGAAAAPLGALIPYVLVKTAVGRRMGKLEEQLPDAIDLMGRAMRAGHPMSAGFKMIAEEAPAEIAFEFRQVFEEQRFGLPIDDSLLGFAERVHTTDARILVTAIMVHRQVGGNLAEILDNIAAMVRERFKLRRQLRVITAQGRMSGYVLGALPVALGVAIYTLNPEYMMPLFEEPLGRIMLVGGLVFQVLGYLWIRRILDIEF